MKFKDHEFLTGHISKKVGGKTHGCKSQIKAMPCSQLILMMLIVRGVQGKLLLAIFIGRSSKEYRKPPLSERIYLS